MSVDRTDAVAVATIVGAAALTFVGANALFASNDARTETCSFDSPYVSVIENGHHIQINTGPTSRAVIVQGLHSSGDDMRKRRRRRHRHRHPHADAERRFEMSLERCVEAQIEAQLEHVEAEIDAQMREVDMRAVEARVQAELSKVEGDLERLRFRVRAQKPD